MNDMVVLILVNLVFIPRLYKLTAFILDLPFYLNTHTHELEDFVQRKLP